MIVRSLGRLSIPGENSRNGGVDFVLANRAFNRAASNSIHVLQRWPPLTFLERYGDSGNDSDLWTSRLVCSGGPKWGIRTLFHDVIPAIKYVQRNLGNKVVLPSIRRILRSIVRR